MKPDISAWHGPKVKCPQCGLNIENRIDQLIGSCADLRCRGPFLAKKRHDQEAERRAADAAILEKAVDLLRGKLDAKSRSQVDECYREGRIFRVPHSNATLKDLPSHRIERFEEHLDSILEQAQAILSQPKLVHSVQVEYAHRNRCDESKPILPVLNGCATCRGYCCRNGGDEAFLTPQFVTWLLVSELALSPETIKQIYLDHLPKQSIEDSCVFHSERGCVLDRRWRATICNDFYCWELQETISKYTPSEQASWIAISPQNDSGMRIGIMAPNSNRIELVVSSVSNNSE